MLLTEVKVDAIKTTAPRDTQDGSPSELPVYLARPAGQGGQKRPALLLIQEIFGVNPHIQDVVRRYAAAGYVVAAPDLFYRTEPWLSFTYDQFAEVRPIVATLTEELVVGDVAATLDLLAAQPDVDATRIGVVGYCFGGRISFVSAARFADRIKAAAIYYGGGIAPQQSSPDAPAGPIARAGEIKCPIISFWGALDKHIPEEMVRRVDTALTEAGVRHATHFYPGVDHGFFCDARATYHPQAAQDAWARTTRFFEQHLSPVPEVTWV